MDCLFSHTQFSSADATSPTAWCFTALYRLHRLCASVCSLCITCEKAAYKCQYSDSQQIMSSF